MNDSPLEHSALKHFVRESLGCGCPDDVFEDVRVTQGFELLGADATVYEIGGRLFVAVIVPGNWRDIAPILVDLVEAGKNYRDGHAFNRFRLVIVSDSAQAGNELPLLFDQLQNTDDRTHLHVIRPEQLPHHVTA